jgi:hypothetical protein
MYINWGHDAASVTGDVATGKMKVTVNFHWYNNLFENIDPHQRIEWEVSILNPDPTTYATILKDTWKGTLQFFPTASDISIKMLQTSPSVGTTPIFHALQDYRTEPAAPTAPVLDTAVTPTAGVNDLTLQDGVLSTDELCLEKWTIPANGATPAKVRCVRAVVKFQRPFTPATYDTTQKLCDIKLDYRRYEINAAWKFYKSTDALTYTV